jgi:hypothetical protein
LKGEVERASKKLERQKETVSEAADKVQKRKLGSLIISYKEFCRNISFNF